MKRIHTEEKAASGPSAPPLRPVKPPEERGRGCTGGAATGALKEDKLWESLTQLC
jgi:hypothetical protein